MKKLFGPGRPGNIMNTFTLGSLVTINTEFLGEKAGTVCYVYEHYKPYTEYTGISLITENGVDLGGFNVDEQDEYLEYAGDTGMCYNFNNVIQLKRDWDEGLFADFFHQRHRSTLDNHKTNT
jgi:hypothetical protein